MLKPTVTAAVLLIGDEILSGRTKDRNLGHIAEYLGKIGVDVRDSFVVDDSVWDLLAARRATALGIGVLSGGYGREELIYSGAFRVYEDPHDLLDHLDELGVRNRL